MNSLKIPDHGLMLKGSAGKDIGPLPPQAFAISLNDSVIEGMIRCVQDGGDIQLALGARPTFHYGSKSHRISGPPESNPYDLYITKPFESTREAYQLPLTMSIFSKPNKFLKTPKSAVKVRTEKAKPAAKEQAEKVKPAAKEQAEKAPASGTLNSPNLDSDIEALQNDLKRRDEAKGRSVIVAGLPHSRKGGNKAKPTFFSNTNTNGNHRSMSTSPALKPIGSPSPNLSAAEQAMERAKRQRKMVVHELAARDRSFEYLKEKWDGLEEDFKAVLEKTASMDSSTKKWTMAKTYWKELDPYMYNYDDDDDRQQAIDNAIRQFDKQRISPSEPQWQKLLPKNERGQGKCLSRLQDKLAKTLAAAPPPPPPKLKVHKAEDSSSSKDDADTSSDKFKSGGEPMSRTSSNSLPKPKLSGKEAQAKRLLSNSKPKASTSTLSSQSQKVAPAKPKIASAPPKPNGKPALSQEYIYDSDSAEEHSAAVPKPKIASEIKSKPRPKQAAKPVARPAEKTVEKSITAKPRPVAPPMPKVAAKRPREEDDSSSSSGTPLSKRIKAKAPLPAPSSQVKTHPREAPPKATKSTSPAKSSPLASSSPTNASDLSEDERPMPSRPPVAKKRKAEDAAPGPATKRPAVSAEVVSQAHRFKAVYSQYEALHHEIAALDNPPREKLADLTSMRERLQSMKAAIYLAHEGSRG